MRVPLTRFSDPAPGCTGAPRSWSAARRCSDPAGSDFTRTAGAPSSSTPAGSPTGSSTCLACARLTVARVRTRPTRQSVDRKARATFPHPRVRGRRAGSHRHRRYARAEIAVLREGGPLPVRAVALGPQLRQAFRGPRLSRSRATDDHHFLLLSAWSGKSLTSNQSARERTTGPYGCRVRATMSARSPAPNFLACRASADWLRARRPGGRVGSPCLSPRTSVRRETSHGMWRTTCPCRRRPRRRASGRRPADTRRSNRASMSWARVVSS